MNSTKRRSGFTLPEILVTVTIIAVLAAVVVPAVVQQVNKGSVPSAGSDLIGIRTAINSFATDTRHFPRRLTQLSGGTLASGDSDITGALFGSDAGNFHGPYLASTDTGHTMPSGAYFQDSLRLSASNMLCMVDTNTVRNPAISQIQAAAIDSALDNGNGKLNGIVTWTDSTQAPAFAKIGTFKVCLVSKG